MRHLGFMDGFLIAPDGVNATRLGDSGTVWHLRRRDEPSLLPIGVEWGLQAHNAAEGATPHNFALATSLSNVCKLLDVELVHENDLGAHPTWGQLGHYSIGAFACDAAEGAHLSKLMTDNLDRVSFASGSLDPKDIKKALGDARTQKGFIPLADVPDIVWKNTPSAMRGGRDHAARPKSTGPEHPTHFGDIDEPHPKTEKTLRAMCMEDPANVDVDVWRAFYDDCGHKTFDKRGLLPFRVWQLFDEMVDALGKGDLDRFVCAAGVVSHYVGDACQPLHGSMLADGYKDRPTTVTHTKKDGSGTTRTASNSGAGVHSTYETAMIDRYSAEIVAGLPGRIGKLKKPLADIASGKDAAIATVALMDRTAGRIPPKKLVNAFIAAGETKSVGVQDKLWKKFGEATIDVMADGAAVLAAVWEGAWAAGGGDKHKGKIGPRDFDKLQAIYEDPKFAPSRDLDHVKALLKG